MTQRTRIAELLGRILTLEAEWTRTRSTRHHREHHAQTARPPPTADHRTLDERLKAARSNLRFQDGVSLT